MITFPNIENSWNMIAHRPVRSHIDYGYHLPTSLKGRGVCLLHTLATPLKALSGLGKLVLSTIEVATITFEVLTLNANPKRLYQATTNIIDVAVGTVLLPIALVANIIRGVVGTIFYPGAMIKEGQYRGGHDYDYKLEKPILYGTLVNNIWY